MRVGETVHYVSRGSADGVFDSECRAAIVTRQGAADGLLDLCVLNPSGMFFDLNLSEGTGGGYWHAVEECPEEEF